MGKEAVSATWVHEKSLSLEVIAEYEKGVSMAVTTEESCLGGQISVTAAVDVHVGEDEPQRKKPKTERWITPSSLG